MRGLEVLAAQRLPGGEGILQRPEHQRERRPELVADVREERRLGAIYFGERLGTLLLGLVGPGRGKTCGKLPDEERQKLAVLVVVRPMRIEAGDDDPDRSPLAGRPRDREHHRFLRCQLPWPLRPTSVRVEVDDRRGTAREHGSEGPMRTVLYADGFRGGGVRGVESREGQTLRRPRVRVEPIGQRKRHVARLAPQALRECSADVLHGFDLAKQGREATQERDPAFADHPLRLFDDEQKRPPVLPCSSAGAAL